ncbi:hypothetical protein GA0070616_4175 [Micromonospora nigra]|uniref:WD40-like Beta Propeller Repeat n=1 Tax=Micromonospora nigra TaxID=145857 RepID=A0A1C6SNC6_9ACTN|nr:hypothetical protein [Micromonospora nigra]SCL30958.1 hypothetical protein GA0070616_4175 [Micromonospora nigra]
MRRAVSSVTVALGLFGATVAYPGAAAVAAPLPAVSSVSLSASLPVEALPAAAPGKKRCAVTDPRLRELSGLVATRDGYVVVNDGTEVENRKRVFYLDADCEVTREVRYSGAGPFDTEDLALSPDGKTLWIADTGDNALSRERRERVALWSMPVAGSRQPVLHRLSYPENKPHDAEALLINGDGAPLIITKVTAGTAEIYTPAAAMKRGDTAPVPMKKVGDIELPRTETENPLSTFGRVAITGAARSPDGSRVVLRTYADAFEYDVSDGDVVAALTTGEPRVTALTDPFGEAISYSPDGKTFLTVSEASRLEDDEPVDILSYTPSTEGAKPLSGAADEERKAAGQSWFASLTLDDITYLIAAVGVLGALLVGAGITGIVRARRRPAPLSDKPSGREPDGGVDGPFPVGDNRQRGGVYGGGSPGGTAPAGGGGAVYGGARPAGGGVYGGARPAGGAGVYGGAGRSGGGRQGGGVAGGGVPVSGRDGAPGGGRRGDAPGGARGGAPVRGRPSGGVYGGGRPAGDQQGGGYGGGRAEPPRRGGPEQDPRGQRPARWREDGRHADVPDTGGGYGYQGDRY